MKIIRYVAGIALALVCINLGTEIADHFEFSRKTCIFFGGLLYAAYMVGLKMIDVVGRSEEGNSTP